MSNPKTTSKNSSGPAVHAELAAPGLSAEKLGAVLCDPLKAPQWSKWITAMEPVASDIWLARTPEGSLRMAWWYRPGRCELVLRFKVGYFAADAHYHLSRGDGDAALQASFPLHPGTRHDVKERENIQHRLEEELAALVKLAV